MVYAYTFEHYRKQKKVYCKPRLQPTVFYLPNPLPLDSHSTGLGIKSHVR